MSETITVRWCGRDVEVAMVQVGTNWTHGRFGPIALDHEILDNANGRESLYSAGVRQPDILDPGDGKAHSLQGHGSTAQEALDQLSFTLVAMSVWIVQVMRLAEPAAAPAEHPPA